MDADRRSRRYCGDAVAPVVAGEELDLAVRCRRPGALVGAVERDEVRAAVGRTVEHSAGDLVELDLRTGVGRAEAVPVRVADQAVDGPIHQDLRARQGARIRPDRTRSERPSRRRASAAQPAHCIRQREVLRRQVGVLHAERVDVRRPAGVVETPGRVVEISGVEWHGPVAVAVGER